MPSNNLKNQEETVVMQEIMQEKDNYIEKLELEISEMRKEIEN